MPSCLHLPCWVGRSGSQARACINLIHTDSDSFSCLGISVPRGLIRRSPLGMAGDGIGLASFYPCPPEACDALWKKLLPKQSTFLVSGSNPLPEQHLPWAPHSPPSFPIHLPHPGIALPGMPAWAQLPHAQTCSQTLGIPVLSA